VKNAKKIPPVQSDAGLRLPGMKGERQVRALITGAAGFAGRYLESFSWKKDIPSWRPVTAGGRTTPFLPTY